MSVLLWNVSGLQNQRRAGYLARLLEGQPCHDVVVGLVETRWNNCGKGVWNSRRYRVAVSVNAVGKSGGIALLVRRGVAVSATGVMSGRCIWADVDVGE